MHCRLFLLLALSAFTVAGCTEPAPKIAQRFAPLPPHEVPDYLKGTILQYTDLAGKEPFAISGYGLVVHLQGTGGSRVPTAVRAFMLKELARHDFGSIATGWETPEQVLESKDVAIVRVDGLIPPGARSGTSWSTWFDARVTIPPESDATSLAHGELYQCDLKVNGANPLDPGNGMVLVKAQASGSVFINPSFVVDSSLDTAEARNSRKTGVVLDGARAMEDRPLILRLLAPGNRMARAIESRIIDRFADVLDDDLHPASDSDNASPKKVANARDEGLIDVYVPKLYSNDVEHFAGIVRHLYMEAGIPEFVPIQARKLADAALLPDAKLLDISYAWEGLGPKALFAVEPLLSSDKPDVQFAAARAAVFLGDPAGVPVLLAIAETKGNPFRLNAVQALASLPATPHVDRLCRELLDSDEATVRIEAYKLLARHEDPSVYTRWVRNRHGDELFALDLVRSNGKPLVYASSQGMPRVAVFGEDTQLDLPLIFTSMDQKLTISSDDQGSTVTIFYRGSQLPRPVSVVSTASLPEIISRLAGDSDTSASGLHFNYTDVVGIVQQLIDQQRVSGRSGPARLLASFMLQEQPRTFEPLKRSTRGLLRDDGGRPQSDQPAAGDKPAENNLLRGSSTTQPLEVGVR